MGAARGGKEEESGPTNGFDQHAASRKAQCNRTPLVLNDSWRVLFIYGNERWHPFVFRLSQIAARERTALDLKQCLHSHIDSRNQPRPTGSKTTTQKRRT